MTKSMIVTILFCLSLSGSLLAAETAEKKTIQTSFRIGITQPPMYTLTLALAYGSPVETVLVKKDEQGKWRIPENLTALFWNGAKLEPELDKILAKSDQAAIALMEAAGVQQLPKRTPTEWKTPEDEDPHMESLAKGYGMVQTNRPKGMIDDNYWLDPLNAMAALETIKTVLQGVDKRNHWAYQANSDQIVQALWEMDVRISKLLHEVSNQPFVVLQDEFQYFEQRYRLKTIPAGGSTKNIVDKAKERDAKCVVATRTIEPKLKSALDQAGLNSIVLDPAGRHMPQTTGAFFKWFGNMISELNLCMKD